MEDCCCLLEHMKENVQLAVGCTEPVAVGYLACELRKHVVGEIESIRVITSEGIFKNGKGVYIPSTSLKGLKLASSIGMCVKHPGEKLLVFQNVTDEEIEQGVLLDQEGKVSLEMDETKSSVYVKIEVVTDQSKGVGILQGAHDHIVYLEVDGKILYEQTIQETQSTMNFDYDLSEVVKLAETIDLEKISYMYEGMEVNYQAALIGLEKVYGTNLGQHLHKLMDEGHLNMDSARMSRMLTSAAADVRMGGGQCAIMTSGGSGNQGIGVVLPIRTVSLAEGIEHDRVLRALFLGHLMNQLVKQRSGKLSGMCGCAIGASIGAAAGITWMLGGGIDEITESCHYIFANISGMLCDGAKVSCSSKLSTTAEEAVIASYLAIDGYKVERNSGVIGNTLEETIENIGYLSNEAYPMVNKKLLDII